MSGCHRPEWDTGGCYCDDPAFTEWPDNLCGECRWWAEDAAQGGQGTGGDFFGPGSPSAAADA